MFILEGALLTTSCITGLAIVQQNCETSSGADLGGGCRGCAPSPEITCGFLIQLVFCKKKKKTIWFIGVEVEQETSEPPPKKNPGSACASCTEHCLSNNVFRPKICNREDSVQMYGTLQAKGKNLAWVNKAGLR